jgi:transposase
MIFPRKSRMPVRVQQLLLEHFVAGTTARAAAQLVGVQGRTAVVFFQRLRQLIASKQESFLLSSEIQCDESYVRESRTGRRGPGPSQPVLAFGLFMRDDRIYTAIMPDAKVKTHIPIIRESVSPDSIVCTNAAQAHDVLKISELQYTCIKPVKTVLLRSGYHINSAEHFWNQSRRYLRRFNGIPKTSLYWYLKDCEWRFNGSDHHTLSQQLKDWYQSRLNKP